MYQLTINNYCMISQKLKFLLLPFINFSENKFTFIEIF